MAKIDYPKLEKNAKMKRYYLNKIAWWKNLSIISPILLITIGVIGIVYYSNIDSLYQWHTLPYAIVFILGVIVLLAVKSGLQKKYLNNKDAFLCCAAYLIGEYKGYGYFIYSTENRYSDSWIEKQAKSLSFDEIPDEIKKKAIKTNVQIDINEDIKVLLKAVNLAKLHKNYGTKLTPNKIVMLYVTEKSSFPIKLKFLN